jgi:hypothetical protein
MGRSYKSGKLQIIFGFIWPYVRFFVSLRLLTKQEYRIIKGNKNEKSILFGDGADDDYDYDDRIGTGEGDGQ